MSWRAGSRPPSCRTRRSEPGTTSFAELRARLSEREQLSRQLTDAEQRAASIPGLRERIEELERELAAVNEVLESSRAQTRQLDERLMSSERVLREVFGSPSWQVTKPLRYAKRRLTKG